MYIDATYLVYRLVVLGVLPHVECISESGYSYHFTVIDAIVIIHDNVHSKEDLHVKEIS